MSQDLTATESRLRVLLDLVAEQRERQCQHVMAEAEQEAQTLLANARQEAKERIKRAARQAKRQEQEAVNNTRAHLDTIKRQRRLHHLAALLREGRQQLQQEMLARWQHADTRRAWIAGLAQQARRLPPGPLRIHHPLDWNAAEWEGLAASHLQPVTLQPDPGLTAGLVLCRGGTCVDGTLAGLAGDDRQLEARLLALMEPGDTATLANPRGHAP